MAEPEAGPVAKKITAEVLDLEKPLEQVGETKFRAAVALLEGVRDRPGVSDVLNRVRFRLVKLRPTRKPTMQRLFYQPFEDLLVDLGGVPGGILPRGLPDKLWRHIVATGDSETRQRLEALLRRSKPVDVAAHQMIAKTLWPWAAAQLQTLAADPEAIKTVLGSDGEIPSEFNLIVSILQVADTVHRLKRELPPRPVPLLDDEQMGLVRRIIVEAAGGNAELTHALVLCVLARMANRAAFLDSIMGMNLGLVGAEKTTVFVRLSQLIMAEVSDQARNLTTSGHDDLIVIADRARALVIGLIAAEKAFKNDPKARQQLTELRKTAEATVGQVVEDARSTVTQAIPMGAAAPVERLVETENSIMALRKCQTFAGQIGLDRNVGGALTTIVTEVRRKAEHLFDLLTGKASGATDQRDAEREMYWAVRMLELAGTPDDADQLRRRGLKMLG